MLGHRASQLGMFTADQQYLEMVGGDSFYGFLARHGRELFRDEAFAVLYCADNGRNSVAPGVLCLALLLQAHDRVSDAEATARAVFDLRWKVALGLEIEARPFAKSTLQLFRSQLVIHEQAQAIFRRSLAFARQTGYLKGRRMKAALDTTVILGRGAVEDTYNLIGHGIAKLCRVLAAVAGQEAAAWAAAHELGRFFASSLKGQAGLDWDDAAARDAFLSDLIADGQRCLELAREARWGLAAGSDEDEQIRQAAELLTQLLWQDVEPTDRGHQIRRGTAEDRVPSVEDPEQRHGHKSRAGSFTGYKGAIAVDPETQLVTAVDVVPGNAHDGDGAAALVAQAEANTDSEVGQVLGDTAYGSVATRQALGEREIIAPTVKPRTGHGLGKDQFEIDVPGERVRCPMGHETAQWKWVWTRPGKGKPRVQVKRFSFPAELCRACPRYAACVAKQHGRGRVINWHQDEARLQAARALERTEYFQEQYRQRVVVEHRFARLVQLGIRQSRYCGRAKTRFQLLLAATVANLTLLAGALSPTMASVLGAVLAALRATGVTTAVQCPPTARRRLPPTRLAFSG